MRLIIQVYILGRLIIRQETKDPLGSLLKRFSDDKNDNEDINIVMKSPCSNQVKT